MNNISIKEKYKPEIDGLRAFAVIAVIINHFNKDILPSGYLGVDVFFVISGYVITSSLINKKNKNFKEFISRFYARRITRILPALIFFILVMSILVRLFYPEPIFELRTAATSLIGASNIFLFIKTTDYFSQSTSLNPFTHTWSLGVEEQFYIIFPILFWMSGLGQNIKSGSRNLKSIMIITSIISLISFIYIYPINQSSAYFLTSNRFWEIGIGSISFLISSNKDFLRFLTRRSNSNYIFIAIFLLLFSKKEYAVLSTITIVILVSIFILTINKKSIIYKFLTSKLALNIGKLSYSLYLWHWGIISISRWTIGINIFTIPILILTIIGFSVLSYKFVEKPVRSLNKKDLKIYIYIVFTSLFTIILNLIFLPYKATQIYLGNEKKLINKDTYSRNIEANFCQETKNSPKIKSLNETCGETNGGDFNKRIFLLGDSHAGQFIKAISVISKRENFNYTAYVKNGCLFPASIEKKDCLNYKLKALKAIAKESKPGDLVLIANAFYYRFFIQNKNLDNSRFEYLKEEFNKDLDETFNYISSLGLKIIFYLDSAQFPDLKTKGAICQKQWFRKNILFKGCEINKREYLNQRNKIVNKSNFTTKSYSNSLIFWEGIDNEVCNAFICNATNMKDDNHFYDYYSKNLLEKFLLENKLIY